MEKRPHFAAPFPTTRPTRHQCTNCGHVIPKDRSLPDSCPVCGSPKEAFILVEED
ncbi:MAG: DUF7130 family rubredoxin-like protein [bacterium]